MIPNYKIAFLSVNECDCVYSQDGEDWKKCEKYYYWFSQGGRIMGGDVCNGVVYQVPKPVGWGEVDSSCPGCQPWKVLWRKGHRRCCPETLGCPPRGTGVPGRWALSCMQGQGLHTRGDKGHSSQVSPLHDGRGHQAVLPAESHTPVIFRTF